MNRPDDNTRPTFIEVASDFPIILISSLVAIVVGVLVISPVQSGQFTLNNLSLVIEQLTTSPAPEHFFGPYDAVWGEMYRLYFDAIIPLMILSLMFSTYASLTTETVSVKTLRIALYGIFGGFWWWISTGAFILINRATVEIVPLGLFGEAPTALSGGLIMAVADILTYLVLSLYFLRNVVFFVSVLAMPVLLAIASGTTSYLRVVAKPADSIVRFTPPFLLFPVMTAGLVRILHETLLKNATSDVWWVSITLLLLFSLILPIVGLHTYLRLLD